MSRLRVDPRKCQAYGTCAQLAPQLFDLDEWGYAQTVTGSLVGEDEHKLADAAVGICPVEAIRLLS
jgi:ferredoxin